MFAEFRMCIVLNIFSKKEGESFARAIVARATSNKAVICVVLSILISEDVTGNLRSDEILDISRSAHCVTFNNINWMLFAYCRKLVSRGDLSLMLSILIKDKKHCTTAILLL